MNILSSVGIRSLAQRFDLPSCTWLFNLPFPLSAFPYVDKVAEFYNSFWTPGRVAVQTATNPNERLGLQLDREKRTITLRRREDPNWKRVLTYEQVSPEIVTLAGALNGSEMTAIAPV